MDDIEESAPMQISKPKNHNITIIDHELVVSEPIKASGEERMASRKEGKERNNPSIEDSKDGGKEDLEEGEHHQTKQALKDVKNSEQVVTEKIKVHDDEMVTNCEGKEKVDHAKEIVGTLECAKDKGKETNELHSEGATKSGAITNVDDGEERSDQEGIEKLEDGGARKNPNGGEEKSNEEGTIKIKVDGEKHSENGQEMGKGNDKSDSKEEAKDNKSIEVIKKKTNKLMKKDKMKKLALVSTNANNAKNVVRKKVFGKVKEIRLSSTSTNKDIAKNMHKAKSSHEKMKTKVEEACIEVKEEEKIVDGEKSLGRKRKRLNKKDAKSAKKGKSSLKKNTKVDTMGMIFMCSSKTKKDCYQYKVLGSPASKKDLVLKIYKGMRLFLFDIDLKLLYGIYKAESPGGFNIEPNAFNSTYPSQVRFTVLKDCLPVGQENFKDIIKDNYYSKNKFHCQLTSDQVKNLCKLFHDASEGPKSKQTDIGSNSKHIDKHLRSKHIDKGPRSKLIDKGSRSHNIDKGPKFREIERNPKAHDISIDNDRRRRRRKDRGEYERHLASVKDKKRKGREQEGRPIPFSRKDRKLNDREQERHLAAPFQDHFHYSYPAPMPRLLPPSLPLPYGYDDRTFRTEIYREREPIDLSWRHQAEILRIDPYHERRAVDLELRRHDEILRIDPRQERQAANLGMRTRDEMECHGVYIFLRERPLYRDPIYFSSDLQPEYYRLGRPRSPAEYHFPSSLPTEYYSRRHHARFFSYISIFPMPLYSIGMPLYSIGFWNFDVALALATTFTYSVRGEVQSYVSKGRLTYNSSNLDARHKLLDIHHFIWININSYLEGKNK
ncbi:hypothetical protein ACFE04_014824 [Oxalis oulophora]